MPVLFVQLGLAIVELVYELIERHKERDLEIKKLREEYHQGLVNRARRHSRLGTK